MEHMADEVKHGRRALRLRSQVTQRDPGSGLVGPSMVLHSSICPVNALNVRVLRSLQPTQEDWKLKCRYHVHGDARQYPWLA